MDISVILSRKFPCDSSMHKSVAVTCDESGYSAVWLALIAASHNGSTVG